MGILIHSLWSDKGRSGRGCLSQIFTKADRGDKLRTCVGFMGLKKVYNREALWHMLRMYDVGYKLLNGILKSKRG